MMTSALTQLGPQSFAETLQLAEIASKSGLVPSAYRGKVQDIIIAIQKGAEVGLSPLQSLDSISVINGKAAMWGDALLAVCMAHATFIDIQEGWDNKGTEQAVAHCKVRRLNRLGEVSVYEYRFGVDDAKTARLWNNKSKIPWIQYPMRMLQMRARTFCLRTAFADALKGFGSVEEIRDYHKDITPNPAPVKHPALDAVVPSTSSTSTVRPEYVMCDAKELEEVEDFIDPHAAAGSLDVAMNTDLVEPPPGVKPQKRGLVSILEVPGVLTPEKPKKAKKKTNKERCADAIKLYREKFKVSQDALLRKAEIKTLDKVTNKQINWLLETYNALKSGALTPAEVFGDDCFEDSIPPVPPVPSSGKGEDAHP